MWPHDTSSKHDEFLTTIVAGVFAHRVEPRGASPENIFGRALRLDPFGLPVRFSASDALADGRVRDIELHRKRVVLRRSLHGMRMALNMPVAAFDGISLLQVPGEAEVGDVLAVMLIHSDPALTLPLFLTSEPEEALDEWQAWSQVLDLPLLLPKKRQASVEVKRPRPRRRRRSALKARRPTVLFRRKPGKITDATPVHRGEREIIARN